MTAEEAQAIALGWLNKKAAEDPGDVSVIQSCSLSARGDYWIVRANTADFVLRGMWEKCRVGLNAVLVSTTTGGIETVGSGQSVEGYLQDKYDLEAAGGKHYILGPTFGRQDKALLIHLRQRLDCRLTDAMLLMSAPQNAWMTGRLGDVQTAKRLLEQQKIEVAIWLSPERARAIEVDASAWHWDALKAQFHRLIDVLAGARHSP